MTSEPSGEELKLSSQDELTILSPEFNSMHIAGSYWKDIPIQADEEEEPGIEPNTWYWCSTSEDMSHAFPVYFDHETLPIINGSTQQYDTLEEHFLKKIPTPNQLEEEE